MKFKLMCLLAFAAFQATANELSLKDLYNTKVTIASGTKGMSIRESPGILTVINQEDIKNSGARDLSELLRQIPGMEMAVDVQGVVGLGIRGNWAHEGKVLLLVNGVEMNENSYSTTQFGNHYPLEHIDRVEIIRGPGSALYGGYAELGVINLVTHKPDENYVKVETSQFSTKQDPTLQSYSITNGWSFDEDEGKLLLFARTSGDRRSDGVYQDIYGDRYAMQTQSDIQSQFFQGRLDWKGLELDVIHDQYDFDQRSEFDYVIEEISPMEFAQTAISAKYTWNLSESFQLIPRVSQQWMSPWTAESNAADDNAAWKVNNVLQNAELVGAWDPNEEFNLIVGVKGRREASEVSTDAKYFPYEADEPETFYNGDLDYSIWNLALFTQAIYISDWGNFTAGSRYEINPEFGNSFVPRAAYTFAWEDTHLKLLASQAFRTPSIENINAYQLLKQESVEGYRDRVRPEKTSVLEAELGHQITDELSVVVNGFWTKIKDPILYQWIDAEEEDEEGKEGYRNFDETGSYGVELEVLYKGEYLNSHTTYSGYRAFENIPESYASNEEGVFLAFPQHKVTQNFTVDLDPFFINFVNIFTSERPSFVRLDEDEEGVIENLDPHWMSNLTVRAQDLFLDGFMVEAGLYNLLDQELLLAQPIDSWHAPLPGKRREFGARMAYNYSF